MDYVAIFEGGGAKGLAHVGALKATENRNISYKSVGGTSAGAIIAALVAAGFTADELFDPQNVASSLFKIDFLDFLDKDTWRSVQAIFSAFRKIKASRFPKLKSIYYYWKFRNTIDLLITEKGLFDTQKFCEWLEEALKQKLNKADAVTFKDLKIPLTIISTDVSSCNIRVFSQTETPDFCVSEAVASSIAIPLFFKPINGTSRGQILVDGGVVSNYPTWIFDKERQNNEGGVVTLGYKLTEKSSETEPISASFYNYLLQLLSSALWGDQSLEIRGIESLHSIQLQISAGTLQFDLNDTQKRELYAEGKASTEIYFSKNIGLSSKEEITGFLEIACLKVKKEIKAITGKEVTHLRSNIFIPTFQDSRHLRLMYSYGMKDDPDDRLVIDIGSGAAGLCFEKGRPIICDLEKAKTVFESEWKFNKYQQALVRNDLKSLISLPITNPEDSTVIAVLSFDSKDDLLNEFLAVEASILGLSALSYKTLVA